MSVDRSVNKAKPIIKQHIRMAVLAIGAAAIVALGAPVALKFRPAIVYNASASAPIGFYRVRVPDHIQKGDLVLMRTPKRVRSVAAQRDYLPLSVPMIKHVVALQGDQVCGRSNQIFINGRLKALRQDHDRLGRLMPHWTGCVVLSIDEMFVLNSEATLSFDGRYFGVVNRDLVIGKLASL